jgi:hypothetical protein
MATVAALYSAHGDARFQLSGVGCLTPRTAASTRSGAATGCHALGAASQGFVETAVLTIPPAVTGLEFVLEAGCRTPRRRRSPRRTASHCTAFHAAHNTANKDFAVVVTDYHTADRLGPGEYPGHRAERDPGPR